VNPELVQQWQQLKNKTHESAAELCEQLRLVFDATIAAKLKGDFRTGKRLNLRKVIPFIVSGFRKDKIWMRRIQHDQRNYQVLLSIDNSLSMNGITFTSGNR
jgi:midasin